MSDGSRVRVGSLKSGRFQDIAEQCALRIVSYRRVHKRVVTVDMRQTVYVEPPEVALEADVVGCYTTDRSLKELADQIWADLCDFYEGRR